MFQSNAARDQAQWAHQLALMERKAEIENEKLRSSASAKCRGWRLNANASSNNGMIGRRRNPDARKPDPQDAEEKNELQREFFRQMTSVQSKQADPLSQFSEKPSRRWLR